MIKYKSDGLPSNPPRLVSALKPTFPPLSFLPQCEILPDQVMETPTVKQEWAITRDEGGDFERIIHYGKIKYHLLLRWNTVEKTCVENAALRKVYDAMEIYDGDGVMEGAEECVDLALPLLEEDYNRRKESDETIKLQVVTENDVLRAVTHNVQLQYPQPSAIENTFPGLLTVLSADIEKLEKIEGNVYKVRTMGQVYCMKTVIGSCRQADFDREISILTRCSHPNIIQLVGLVVDVHEKVESFLLEYVHNAQSLRDVESLSADEFDKWTKELHSAISYLHQNGMIWGDAKAGNTLIRARSVLLIDFGGGYTPTWVDKEHSETENGDWQGYDRIVDFLRKRL